MTCHSLLALVFAVSCFASSSCNVGDIASLQVTYPARVLHTSQEECPSDDQQQIVRAEIGQDLVNILQSLSKCSLKVTPGCIMVCFSTLW